MSIFSAITINILFVLLVIGYFEMPKIEERQKREREQREFYYSVVNKLLKKYLEYLEKEKNNDSNFNKR